jgi:hypothetical protein
MRIAFFRFSRRFVLPVLASLALAACSGSNTPPMGIDDDTTVSSIPPDTAADNSADYSAPVDPVQATSDSADYLDTPNLAGRNTDRQPSLDDAADTTSQSRDLDEPAERSALPKIDEEPVVEQQTIRQSNIPDDGVNMDQALGAEPVGLAEEQARDIAEGETSQPVVDGIGTDTLTERSREERTTKAVDFTDATSADQITLPSRRRNVAEETEVAMLPQTEDPTLDTAPPVEEMSSAEKSCRSDLERMGVRFEEMEPISDGRSCGIAHPIKVSGFQGGIQLKPAATLNCQMTRIFAKWVKNELVPTSRYRYFSGIKTIHQMSSYSCRKMNSRSNNPWSEHAKGNALDIGGFTLKNGKHIDVRKKSFFAFREKGLLKTVREDSCKYFNTVLGPGDAYHGDHFHFDLRYRKSGYRHCSL